MSMAFSCTGVRLHGGVAKCRPSAAGLVGMRGTSFRPCARRCSVAMGICTDLVPPPRANADGVASAAAVVPEAEDVVAAGSSPAQPGVLPEGILYGSVGFFCGLVGQGIANLIMTAKRNVKKSEDDVPVPPLLKTSALWGVFLGVSSNTRYQIINGLEHLVEVSPIAKCVPAASLVFTVGVRFANNVYGGMQFVDWARMSGCQ